jgi:hypothetical protein
LARDGQRQEQVVGIVFFAKSINIHTCELLAGDLRIGVSLKDAVGAMGAMVSPSAVTVEGFQPIPLSCIAFEASVMMTYSSSNNEHPICI